MNEIVQRECRPLMDACTSGLYKINSFRVLGISVTATVRQIKRRIDELTLAIEMDDLESEYVHTLLPRQLTDTHDLQRAAKRLQDPQTKFVDKFFWFWPLNWEETPIDQALNALANGDRTMAETIWSEHLTECPVPERLAAMHNLAVLYQVSAMDMENECYKGEVVPTPSEVQKLTVLWQNATDMWREIVDDEGFWGLLAEKVCADRDPSLTNGFLYRFRKEFPSALDNINVDFSAAHAKRGRYFYAAWHIQFIQRKCSKGSIFDTSIRQVTKPFHAQIEHAIKRAVSNLRDNPTSGASRVERLLVETSRPLNILITLLGSTHPEVTETRDEIAKTCCDCAIAYGNDTEDWDTGNELLDKSSVLAVTPRLLKNIAQCKSAMQRNREYQARNNLSPKKPKKKSAKIGIRPPTVQPHYRKEDVGQKHASRTSDNRPPPVPSQYRTEYLARHFRQHAVNETGSSPDPSRFYRSKLLFRNIVMLVILSIIIGICLSAIFWAYKNL